MRGESPLVFAGKTVEYFDLVHAILAKEISIDNCFSELKQIEFIQIEPDSIWFLANPSYNLSCIIDLIQRNRDSIGILNHELMSMKAE